MMMSEIKIDAPHSILWVSFPLKYEEWSVIKGILSINLYMMCKLLWPNVPPPPSKSRLPFWGVFHN